jgi:hypothetical protein
MNWKTKIIFLGFFWVSLAAFSQEMPTEKEVQNEAYWANFNVNYFNKYGSWLFFESNLRHSTFPNAENLGIAPLTRIQNTLGYEFRLSEQWGLGVSGRYVMEKRFDTFFSKVHLNHAGKIGNIQFLKQIGVEQVSYFSRTLENQGRFSGLFALAYNINLDNKRVLRPSLSYEFQIWFDWRNPAFPQSKRRIDQTMLKAEIAYFLNQKWSLGLFFIHQTDYYFALAQYDKDGTLIKPDRKLNLLTPTIGFRVHYLLKNKDLSTETRLRFLPY